MDNNALLDQLLADGVLRMEAAAALSAVPKPLPPGLQFGRIEGMLLGLAVGDALGNTSESLNPVERAQRYGEIRDYLPDQNTIDFGIGIPSDDTQMAFWTIEVLLQDGRLNLERLAQRFSEEPIFGIGSSVRQFLRNFKDRGMPWQQAGADSAGNGALMRIAPVLLPHLQYPSRALWADAALAGMVTHNDPASNAACVAFVAMLWDLLGMARPPAPDWWLDRFCQMAAPLEGVRNLYHSRVRGIYYEGPIWRYTYDQVWAARRSGLSTRLACDHWGSGAYLMETLPSVLYILERHAHDPEQAIIRAVNDTHDNDTVAAIVGAAVGALHGKRCLPLRWLKNLSGRTNLSNDGHVFALIDQARQKFWEGRSILRRC